MSNNITLDYVREANLVDKDNPCYPYFKFLPDGTVAFINRLAYTWGLHLGADWCSAYRFRFCFPNFQDAVKAFNELESLFDVPKFGWVAARPEGRLPLSKELNIDMATQDTKLSAQEVVSLLSGQTIDVLIDNGIYNQKQFDLWIKNESKIHEGKFNLDVGAKAFYEYVSGIRS